MSALVTICVMDGDEKKGSVQEWTGFHQLGQRLSMSS